MLKSIIMVIVVGLASVSGSTWNAELDMVDFARWDLAQTFNDWARAFHKTYDSIDEEYKRFAIWVHNLQGIAAYNSDPEHSARLRMNQFGDLTGEEFASMYASCMNGEHDKQLFTIGGVAEKLEEKLNKDDVHVVAPASVDWTKEGVVTPVKNQEQCGSCWAFSTTGAIECRYAIKTGKLNSLSEQQLVDCSGSYGNAGCNGGEMDAAFRYVEHEGGLCSEAEYPYTARDGTCKASTCGTKYDAISGYSDVSSDSEPSLVDATAEGCVSVAIEADQFAFQYYSSGVLTGECGTRLDHGVLVVGYGSTGGQDYWKVKNSWGVTWGEQGYVLICRNCDKNGRQGECGILKQPSYPRV